MESVPSAAVSDRAGTAPRAARSYRFATLAPIVALYLLAAAFGVLVARRPPWSGDTGVHLAVLEQLGRHLREPPDPMTGTATAGSVYYSPYALGQALAFRFGGLDPWTIFRISAVCTIASPARSWRAGGTPWRWTWAPTAGAPVW